MCLIYYWKGLSRCGESLRSEKNPPSRKKIQQPQLQSSKTAQLDPRYKNHPIFKFLTGRHVFKSKIDPETLIIYRSLVLHHSHSNFSLIQPTTQFSGYQISQKQRYISQTYTHQALLIYFTSLGFNSQRLTSIPSPLPDNLAGRIPKFCI